MSQAAAKGIRGEPSTRVSLLKILKAFGVVEITFMIGLVGTVILVSVGHFGAPIRSSLPGLSTVFVGLYSLTVLSAMVLAIRWYLATIRLMRGREESSG
ncbi:MAG: hypothetical protein ACREJ6_10890 [Candidatus Methylomirabilis sp.]